jgi:hypothetical protein
MRRSTVPSLPPTLVFPGQTFHFFAMLYATVVESFIVQAVPLNVL